MLLTTPIFQKYSTLTIYVFLVYEQPLINILFFLNTKSFMAPSDFQDILYHKILNIVEMTNKEKQNWSLLS